ncbi:EamA family transporter [Terasakiella sp. A23]|uniref:aromatic amino acid exporter YddG n=1 Tax=Terasakiella sp. FCG-A23 TaxID=3080561 RepID=UPI0029550489|nr:EamA family transporter [Terasakiella sp. A23]MDV7340479.1 EamA family transporter [Terasakiella sp. A23]
MKNKATLTGISAIIMWSLLALFTAHTQGIPPFQLLALSFLVGGTVGLIYLFRRGREGFQKLKQPLSAWALGVGGLFGYHFLYFTALSNAPVVDASLIAYLWPLLIVLFSAFLPGERLKWFHVAGALTGLCGAALLVLQKGNLSFSADYSFGYLAAVGCALTWSIYSVLNRTQGSVPTETVAGFCILTALLAFLCHLMFEQWVTPPPAQWIAILGLGIGPVGAAFYTWDFGTKHGNIKMLGVLSYGAPLLSTLLLTMTGQASATWALGAACLLITGGAVIASLDFFRKETAS